MRQIKNLRLSDIPTAGGGISRAAYALASDTKLSVELLLRRANLSLDQAKNPRLRIAVKDQIKFLNLVADELDDEFLGIRLAQTADLREVGLVYYVMASSETLGEALQRVARYSMIQNEGVRIGYRAGKSVALTFSYFGVARRLDRHQIEFIIAFLLRLCRNLSGLSLVPSQIKLCTIVAACLPKSGLCSGHMLRSGARPTRSCFRAPPLARLAPMRTPISTRFW